MARSRLRGGRLWRRLPNCVQILIAARVNSWVSSEYLRDRYLGHYNQRLLVLHCVRQ